MKNSNFDEITIKAKDTFPSGLTVKHRGLNIFDYLPDPTTRQSSLGANGDLLVWDTPNIITVTIKVDPTSDDHKNLSIVNDRELITITGTNSRDEPVILKNGSLTAKRNGDYTFSFGAQN